MGIFNRVLIYRSKDRGDWEAAQAILTAQNIEHTAWESEELPVGGCGCKIDVRKTSKEKVIPKTVYQIEVSKAAAEDASAALAGKVRPMRSYGV